MAVAASKTTNPAVAIKSAPIAKPTNSIRGEVHLARISGNAHRAVPTCYSYAKAVSEWKDWGVLVLVALLAGCAARPVITKPQEVPPEIRVVFKQPPAELLKEYPIAEGDLRHCPAIASARKAGQQQCNADKRALREFYSEND